MVRSFAKGDRPESEVGPDDFGVPSVNTDRPPRRKEIGNVKEARTATRGIENQAAVAIGNDLDRPGRRGIVSRRDARIHI